MTLWRVVVNFMLPPPLALSVLLLVPLPRVAQKGLLAFAKHVLFFQVGGGLKLVHFMMFITGLMLLGAAVHTHQLRQSMGSRLEMDRLDPKQQITARAHIWREERNFWISVLTFLLWGLLYRINQLMLEHVNLKDKVKSLELALARSNARPTEGAPAPKCEEPTAPEVPEPRTDLLRQRKYQSRGE